jgi:PTS system nitrogen regulatory IIA component
MHSSAASMSLSEIFLPETILCGLEARTKVGAIEEMVRRLVTLRRLGPELEPWVVQMLVAREGVGSTALWGGMAMPHNRVTCTDRYVGALAIDPRGIDFGGPSGDPTHVIFLLLAPMEGRERYFEVLGRIAAIGKQKSQFLQLRGCRTPEEAHLFLRELDRQ